MIGLEPENFYFDAQMVMRASVAEFEKIDGPVTLEIQALHSSYLLLGFLTVQERIAAAEILKKYVSLTVAREESQVCGTLSLRREAASEADLDILPLHTNEDVYLTPGTSKIFSLAGVNCEVEGRQFIDARDIALGMLRSVTATKLKERGGQGGMVGAIMEESKTDQAALEQELIDITPNTASLDFSW